jgi:hypothetical protein
MKHTHFAKLIEWSSRAGASAIGSLLSVVMVGAVFAVIGYALDKSNIFFTGLSADASNTIHYLSIGFWVAPFLYLIAVIINHWITEKSSANQGA